MIAFKKMPILAVVLILWSAIAVAQADFDHDLEAGSNDQASCEGDCISSRYNKSRARLSEAQVKDLAYRLFDKGETPKLPETSTKTIRDR